MNIIEERVQIIEERNIRVEADKAWETSVFRTVTVMILTYIVATAILITIENNQPFKNALVPVLGYFLSTQSLPFLKKYWISKYFKK